MYFISCISFTAFYLMHFISWIYFMHFISCILFHAFYSMNILFNAFYLMHFIECISLKAFHFMHFISCIYLYKTYFIYVYKHILHCIYIYIFYVHKNIFLFNAFYLTHFKNSVCFHRNSDWTKNIRCPRVSRHHKGPQIIGPS